VVPEVAQQDREDAVDPCGHRRLGIIGGRFVFAMSDRFNFGTNQLNVQRDSAIK
jgi:hypothetical protein